jgi:hypothetical protein
MIKGSASLSAKVDIFEKLITSNRSRFLNALAQASDVYTQIDNIISKLENPEPGSSFDMTKANELRNQLANLNKNRTDIDPKQMAQALTQVMALTMGKEGGLPIYNDAWNLYKELQGGSKSAKQPLSNNKNLYNGSKIDPIFQIMLNVNPDGKLGPITQSALNRYKISVKNPEMSNELAFEALKREPEYNAKKAITFDDNTNLYARQTGGIDRQNPFEG